MTYINVYFQNIHRKELHFMIKYLIFKFSCIGRIPIIFFKCGCTAVICALCALCSMCYDEFSRGGVGMALYYAPMLEYILTAFIIFWGGMFLLDLAEKERSAGK